ncbi:hypothetical protein [Thalassotalea sp. ND16A]|uniref:hypothetical protein n=1 Tax=Thalassotalea sp. ND16A TaxID=1535422 RepID=UPI00051D3785|nr:hypothetical protein [Thalassotalea sp. ND16A]KGJ95948.1 hypothetical protein ND16A_1127 [Thalassotalea sp. ND16A]
MNKVNHTKIVSEILGTVLSTNSINDLTKETAILGTIPEFDSMAIMTILTLLEDNYGIIIEDDEISAQVFETFGSLVDYVAEKVD